VDRIGKDGPRVNPFRLEPTESNIAFLYSFVVTTQPKSRCFDASDRSDLN
jgi:hypothetical protein